MSVINRADVFKALEDVGAIFPYRIPGVTETYRPYNEAWNDAIDEAEKAIEALPDADDGWISVEKRLPEIDMSYPHSDYYFVWYDGCDIPDIASYSNVNRFWTEHVTDPYWNAALFCKVIAWMPLPKPYKPKEDK